MTELELIRDAQQGDRAAFCELAGAHFIKSDEN
jgi:hypothetical protein